MKKILINLLCLFCCSLSAQSEIKPFPIEYSREAGMLPITFEDSCLIDELAFDNPVSKAYMFKFSEFNFMITLKFPDYDIVYVFVDGYINTIYEIGPSHYQRIDPCDY